MDFSDLERTLDEFAADRNWQEHHLPRSLMLALVKEVGELTEVLQWVPDVEAEDWLGVDNNRTKVAEEIADIFIYLHYIARATRVDLRSAVRDKLRKNSSKYPAQDGGTACP